MPLSDVGKGLFIEYDRNSVQVNSFEDVTDQSDYDIDEEKFGLPLKSRHLEDNFADILRPEDIKRVRFAECKGRQTVEELLENTSYLNSYVEENLDKIGEFGSKLDCTEWYRSVTPDTTGATGSSRATCIGTNSGGSTSNFQLSDIDDRDMSLQEMVYDQEMCAQDERVSSLLSAHFQLRSQGQGVGQSSPPLSIFEECGQNKTLMSPLLRDVDGEGSTSDGIKVDDADYVECGVLNIEQDLSTKVCKDAQGKDILFPVLNSQEAIAIFESFLRLCIGLTSAHERTQEQQSFVSTGEDAELRSVFCMKSAPTLSYPEYLNRIESKCSLPSVVYVIASFLLIRYCNLQYDEEHSSFSLTYSLDHNSVHRLIVALIRVSTKLLEDCVHSHAYFSKVSGISKKLLTKLELALILLLKSDAGAIINPDSAVNLVFSYRRSIHSFTES